MLVVGAAGTIGAAAVRQLLELGAARLELVDIDENGLARLARDIRSRGVGEPARRSASTRWTSPAGLAWRSPRRPGRSTWC